MLHLSLDHKETLSLNPLGWMGGLASKVLMYSLSVVSEFSKLVIYNLAIAQSYIQIARKQFNLIFILCRLPGVACMHKDDDYNLGAK